MDLRAPLVGLLSAGVAVGVGEAAAAFVRPESAPIIAVGNRVITLTPEPVKQWAIRNFATNDKTFLLTVLYVLVALGGIVMGDLARRRLAYGFAAAAVFALGGVYCALTDNAGGIGDAVPSLVGAAAGAVALKVLTEPTRVLVPSAGPAAGPPRRDFLVAGGASAGVAVLAGFGGRALQHARFDTKRARAAVVLPAPVSPAPPLPADADLGKGGVAFATSNKDFYRIDTALRVPQLDPATWKLRIHGMVDHPMTLTYADVLARPLIERWVTLMCVSNPVGGDLISTARFLGARLADILREAGVQPGADQLMMRSSDGMTIGAPTAVLLDGRDAMLAVGMNGEPLPVAHGFPARVVVPGLYGYVSACKWIVDIEATTFAKQQAYWVDEGWAAQAPVLLGSRIDTPRQGRDVTVGKPVSIAGVAWDQHVGVSKVEVRVDGGEWMPARLAGVPSTDTWRQWVVDWTPTTAGKHDLEVRASDAAGRPQDEQNRDPFPSGATGLHRITVVGVS